MSAIWGCVYFSDTPVEPSLGEKMQKPLEHYVIDRFDHITHRNAVMGCGLQLIRTNSAAERLPVLEEDAGLLFTADCMLDNRAELAAELAADEDPASLPDGALLYRAWRRWGVDCNRHLCGNYAFAVYDYNSRELVISADYISSRSIYYARQGDRLIFGTILRSVAAGMDPAPKLNENWLSDYLSMGAYTFVTDMEHTPYKGIKKIPFGSCAVFTAQDMRAHRHWDPHALPMLELESDDAYKEKYLSTMRETARGIVRDSAGIGVFLSSGMDSTNVAAFAAQALAEEGRDLLSYTQVPMSGYKARVNRYVAEDETANVKTMARMYPNIKQSFYPLDGLDVMSGLPELVYLNEAPHFTVNYVWIYRLAKKAREEGCRIILNGQMGNETISWGEETTLISTYIAQGRLFRALHSTNRFGRRMNVSRKFLFKDIYLKNLFGPISRRIVRNGTKKYMRQISFVDPRFSAEKGSPERINRAMKADWVFSSPVFRQARKARLTMRMLSMIGELFTKMGLATGVIFRDPTSEKRVYELCLNLPLSCFVNDTRTRRVATEYMTDMLPPEIYQNQTQYGSQSADWIDRLLLHWPEVYDQLERACLSPAMAAYVDRDKLRAFLDDNREGADPTKSLETLALLRACMTSYYLQDLSADQS
jgi:asparagine synthase (glutamine-hydrolysing)